MANGAGSHGTVLKAALRSSAFIRRRRYRDAAERHAAGPPHRPPRRLSAVLKTTKDGNIFVVEDVSHVGLTFTLKSEIWTSHPPRAASAELGGMNRVYALAGRACEVDPDRKQQRARRTIPKLASRKLRKTVGWCSSIHKTEHRA